MSYYLKQQQTELRNTLIFSIQYLCNIEYNQKSMMTLSKKFVIMTNRNVQKMLNGTIPKE